jgi:hypothetical protein
MPPEKGGAIFYRVFPGGNKIPEKKNLDKTQKKRLTGF